MRIARGYGSHPRSSRSVAPSARAEVSCGALPVIIAAEHQGCGADWSIAINDNLGLRAGTCRALAKPSKSILVRRGVVLAPTLAPVRGEPARKSHSAGGDLPHRRPGAPAWPVALRRSSWC